MAPPIHFTGGGGASIASINAAIAASLAPLSAALAALTSTQTYTDIKDQVTGTGAVFSAYTELAAAGAIPSNVVQSCFQVSLRFAGAAATKSVIQFSIGAAGVEVVVCQAGFFLNALPTNVITSTSDMIVITRHIPAGTRIAYRSYVEGVTAADVRCAMNLSLA